MIGGRIPIRGAGTTALAIAALAFAAALTLAPASGTAAERVCEGPGINHLPQPAASDDVLSVLAYNVYLLPSHVRNIPFMGERFALAQEERAALIPRFLTPYDVVILSEAYDDGARATLLAGLRAQGFRYATRILGTACRAASSCEKGTVYEQPLSDDAPRGGEGDTWFGEDGGVLIASRHPIGAAKEWVYADCVEPDCNAAKGFRLCPHRQGQRAIPRHRHARAVRLEQGAAHGQGGAVPRHPAVHRGTLGKSRARSRSSSAATSTSFATLSTVCSTTSRSACWNPPFAAIASPASRAATGRGAATATSTMSSPRRAGASRATTAIARWCSAASSTSRTARCSRAVRGQGYCDLSDHWAVWGYFDYRDDAAEPPDCPVPKFPPGSAPTMRR